MNNRIILKTKLPENGGIITLPSSESHRIKNVIRLKVGSELIIIDYSKNIFHGKIIEIKNFDVRVELIPSNKEEKENSSVKITLIASILKSKKFDLVIQKTTEIGVSIIIPLITERTVPKYSEKDKIAKRKRWEKIAIESARQSGRTNVPSIMHPVSFEEIFELVDTKDLKIVLYEKKIFKTREIEFFPDVLNKFKNKSSISFIVGPEGGFSTDDILVFTKNGFIPAYLGRNILRAETASIVAVALTRFILGGK